MSRLPLAVFVVCFELLSLCLPLGVLTITGEAMVNYAATVGENIISSRRATIAVRMTFSYEVFVG